MIVFGTAVTDPETYERCAVPGIDRAAEPDSAILAHQTAGSLFRNYNLLLDKAAAHEDLEALVLLHQDVELVDEDFAARVQGGAQRPGGRDRRLRRRRSGSGASPGGRGP